MRSPQVRPPKSKSRVGEYFYGCDFDADSCGVYYLGGALVSTITNLTYPQGVAVDDKHQVYVVNSGAYQVLIYAPGGSPLVSTLSSPGNEPAFAAVSKTLLAVSDLSSSSGRANVAVYRNRSNGATPSYYLTDPNAIEGESVAFDSKGNCYWSYNARTSSKFGNIDEFRGCKQGAKPINLGITTQFAGGIAFDAEDNLWYTDQRAGTLNVCVSGSGCFVDLTGFGDPITLSWDGSDVMYVMDATAGIYQVNVLGDPFEVAPIPESALPIGVAVDASAATE